MKELFEFVWEAPLDELVWITLKALGWFTLGFLLCTAAIQLYARRKLHRLRGRASRIRL